MSQRQAVVPALDVGHHSFDSFLEERLGDLKNDLLRECDRIANARELILKKELNDLRRQNEEQRVKLQHMTKMAADGVPAPCTDQDNEFIGSNVVDIDDIQPNLDVLASSGDVSRTKDLGANPGYYALWGEWVDAHGSPHVHHTVEGDHYIDTDEFVEEEEEEEFAWAQELNHDPENLTPSACTLNPNSSRAVAWELIGIPILFWDLVTIPMQVFYTFEGPTFSIIGWILITYWTSDMFLRMLVFGHVTEHGIMKLDRKIIMKAYLRGSFTFDFFMVAPDWFSKFMGAGGGMRNVAILRLFRILRLARLMRMSKMKKIMRNIEDLIDSEYFSVGISILCNLFAILGTCHYLGCFWFWVGTRDLDGKSWVEVISGFENADWPYQYVVCLHWAVAQFTPGASRIQPVNGMETIASIAVLIFGLVFLSLFISALAQARQRLQAITSKMDRDNWMLRRYLRQQGVSTDLQIRTMRYVEKFLEPMMLRVQRKDVFLLPLLSRPLQLEVQEQQYFKSLSQNVFFSRLRERSVSLTLTLFVNVIIEVLLADSDLLFDAGSVSHEMYFVSRGSLAYLLHGARQLVFGDSSTWFCEPVIWTPWVHNGTAKATVESHIVCIDSAKFRSTVMEHRERTHVMRCARAYVKDLNLRLDNGEVISDMTALTRDESSAYLRVIRGGKSATTMSLSEIIS